MAGTNPFEAMMAQGAGDEEFPPKNGGKKGKGGGFMKAFQNAKKKPAKKKRGK